ncbi:MAG: hypothetical protein ACSHYA_17540 [Opitutaceae bacterium]
MKKLTLICLLVSATASLLHSKSLKIADAIVFTIPAGWTYKDSKKQTVKGLGKLTSAILEQPSKGNTLAVSVLSVEDKESDVQYPTALVEATLSPHIEAYRKQGNHYYRRKLLWKGDFLFYSQEVGRLESRKVELRGVLIKNGDGWVNFFCLGPREISWEQYTQLINGTKLLNAHVAVE